MRTTIFISTLRNIVLLSAATTVPRALCCATPDIKHGVFSNDLNIVEVPIISTEITILVGSFGGGARFDRLQLADCRLQDARTIKSRNAEAKGKRSLVGRTVQR